MKGVCSRYLDLNFYHYSLQLNIYQKMGLNLRNDFTKGDTVIIHTASERYDRAEDNYIPCEKMDYTVNKIFENHVKKP